MIGTEWRGLVAAVFLFLLLFLAAAEAGGATWQFVGFTRYRDPLYVDLDRTTANQEESSLSVWIRITLAENSLFRGQFKPDLQRVGKTAKDVKYLEMNKEVDCPGSRIRHIKLLYHDQRDRILITTGTPKAPWKPIVEGSLWLDLQKVVCNQKK